MYSTLLLIAGDALLLMLLIKLIADEEIELRIAALIGFVTAVGTSALTYALAITAGLVLPGVIVAGVIAAIGLGLVVSWLLGVEIKRSISIGLIFIVVHIGLAMVLTTIFHL